MSWLRSVERLSRSVPSEVTDARIQMRHLVAAAQAVASLGGRAELCTPDTDCVAAGCPLAHERDGASLCQLVSRLAVLEGQAQSEPSDDADPIVRLRSELAGSVDLVRTCRQTAHPAGKCWLAYPDGREGCSEVLRLAHRAFSARRSGTTSTR